MLSNISSDQLFLMFMTSLVISILFITSGVGVVLPQKYNNGYRKDRRDKDNHDIFRVFMKSRVEQNKKPGLWNYVVSFLIFITIMTFAAFVIKEFVLT